MAEEKTMIENGEIEFKEKVLSRRELVWRAFKRNKLGMFGLYVLIVLYLMALFADFLSPHHPYEQSLKHSFAPPTKIHREYKGERVGAYVLPTISYVDKATFERKFYEMLFPKRLVLDVFGTQVEYEIGKDGVTGFSFMLDEEYYIVPKDGTMKYAGSTTKVVDYLLFGYDEKVLAEGEAEIETSSEAAKDTYFGKYGFRLGLNSPDEIEKVVIKEKLNMILVKKGEDIEMITGKVIDYDYKTYPVKWFVKSWGGDAKNRIGYLFWIFPFHYHLFGVDNYDNNEYVRLYIMGADQYGRDVWSRIVFASRISLSIGFIGMFITFALSLVFGGISGYYGGIVDEFMMRFSEIIMSLPGFYLLILLRSLLPLDIPSTQVYVLLVFILSFIGWAGRARVIRGMVLSIKQREFVEAARALGFPDTRILFRHVLPNTASYLIVAATLAIPGYILGEASLSFLGLGIREPSASWGLMLAQAQNVTYMTKYPWLLIPGIFIFITVLSFNFVGDALRDALDPRSLG
ncbi:MULTISPECIES: ABC transporter permease [unclassified Thermotoga]|uniref:ABC transporter permease n=1 Tax=unclassified Thermotoga TaxID=2631113 RepID=UPI000280EA61|nr:MULTISPECIES: ABC transporter permease [unclassified Thermotoga]AIY85952.1 binding-protein-dependent transport systems inner membrane component [Thermotoga sp. 2812B]EJX26763.1 binding-protein-dependent transport systems inner membrane component [Thermotoga sp. EMP]